MHITKRRHIFRVASSNIVKHRLHVWHAPPPPAAAFCLAAPISPELVSSSYSSHRHIDLQSNVTHSRLQKPRPRSQMVSIGEFCPLCVGMIRRGWNILQLTHGQYFLLASVQFKWPAALCIDFQFPRVFLVPWLLLKMNRPLYFLQKLHAFCDSNINWKKGWIQIIFMFYLFITLMFYFKTDSLVS